VTDDDGGKQWWQMTRTAADDQDITSRKISENGNQLGLGFKRLWRTGGAGGIVSPNASLTRDEPGTS